MEHVIKSEKPYFQAVWDRKKLFEIRLNDRGYNAGDDLILKELNEHGNYSGREIYAKISYVSSFQQKDNHVVFAMKNIRNWQRGGL